MLLQVRRLESFRRSLKLGCINSYLEVSVIEDLRKSETWRVFRIQSELVDGFETLFEIGPAEAGEDDGQEIDAESVA